MWVHRGDAESAETSAENAFAVGLAMPAGKGGEKRRDGTAGCALVFSALSSALSAALR
jgi:hypothetical protein